MLGFIHTHTDDGKFYAHFDYCCTAVLLNLLIFIFFVFSFYYFYCLGMCENGAKILLSVTSESERGESISVGGDGDMDCVSHLDIKNYEH